VITKYYSIIMSRKYENAKIYKLVSNKTADVYIGSCLITLARRLGKHKGDYNSCSSKKMFEVPDAIITIVLIEALHNCKSKAEMKAKELHYMTTMQCINVNRPFVTDIQLVGGDDKEWQKAYREANAPAIREKSKEHYAKNAPAIRERKNEYQAIPANKEHAKAYYAIPANKERQKAYALANKDKINKRKRERYARIKEEAQREIETQSPLLLTHSKEQTPSV